MNQPNSNSRVNILITSPLEAEHAQRIADAFPDRTVTVYRPDLLPSARYIGDHDGEPGWRRSPDQQREWVGLLGSADVLWDFPDRDSEHSDFSRIAPNVRWVQTSTAGVGQIVKRFGLQGSNVIVTTASGIHGQPLAEFVFGALLGYVKQFDHLRQEQQAHRWQRFSTGELAGQTMAIIGPGRIGREIARIATAFRMRVWAMGRDNTPARAAELGVDRLFDRDHLLTMLAGADCVVLCAPHTSETENLIGRSELQAMKRSAVLVNIARGIMVDEAALLEALTQGRLAFAALDVFRTEPLPADSPFWDMPNVLINPHSASTADSENTILTDRFITNLGHFLEGRFGEMAPRLDTVRLY